MTWWQFLVNLINLIIIYGKWRKKVSSFWKKINSDKYRIVFFSLLMLLVQNLIKYKLTKIVLITV